MIQVLRSEKRLASFFIPCHRESFMRKVLKAQQELIKLAQKCKNRGGEIHKCCETSRNLTHYIQISTCVSDLICHLYD